MKTHLLVLLISTGLLACKKEDPPSKVEAIIGQPFDLPNQKTATLPTSSTPVSITLKAVNDARCPIGVSCFLAGYATVEVELADASPGVQTARIGLHTHNLTNYTADSVAVTLNQRPYSLLLLDVTPYPGVANGDETKTARLRLRAR